MVWGDITEEHLCFDEIRQTVLTEYSKYWNHRFHRVSRIF